MSPSTQTLLAMVASLTAQEAPQLFITLTARKVEYWLSHFKDGLSNLRRSEIAVSKQMIVGQTFMFSVKQICRQYSQRMAL